MVTDRKWIVVRIDGKLAGISRDYDRLAEISSRIAEECRLREMSEKKRRALKADPLPYLDIQATAVDFGQVLKLRQETIWEDLMLFGTDFQKRVWKKLWDLTAARAENQASQESQARTENQADPGAGKRLLSYSDFAELCDNRAGVRAIAHALGLNPLPVVIPCHLIVPKEAIDKIEDIRRKAESTIFKGEDLCQSAILEDPAIDFGEYALGKELKRRLIQMDLQ